MSEDAQVILETPTEAVIRDELHRLVLADLHGPLGGETEEFGNERPTDRYVVGRLAPDGTVIEPDTQDETADSNGADLGEDQPEPSAPNIVSIAPSAMGCTSYVAGDTAELSVHAEWAWYRRTASETESEQARVWQRVPVHGSARITLADGELGPQQLNSEYPQVLLRGRARRHEGNWLVSLFLVNAQPRPSTLPDSAWLFQVRLVLTGPDGGPVFLPRPDTTSGGDQADKAEQRRLAMAYRACPEFAVGHGTGVHVTPADGDPMRAVEIATAAVPSYEIPFTDAPRPGSDADLPWLDDLVLDMKRLAELDLPDLVDRADAARRPGTAHGSTSRKRGSRILRATSPGTRRTLPMRWPLRGVQRTASRRGSMCCGRTKPRWLRSGSLTRPCTCSGCTRWPRRPAPETTR